MADDIGYTPGSGATIAADLIGGALHQRVKLSVGADGEAADLDSGQALSSASIPVVLASDHGDVKVTLDSEAVVLGAGTAAIGKLAANDGIDIGNVDVASIAAGDNNIGNVDVVTLPALAAGTALIGKVGIDQATANANEVVVKSGTVTTVSTVNAVTAITNALPAGTNAIGKLAANSGVDIGDVDVTSVVPGVGATNLGKARGDAVGSTDTGVGILARVAGSDSVVSVHDGDYAFPALTSMSELKTRDQRAIDLQNCNAYGDWSALNDDAGNIADSLNHVFGTGAISFDKLNGTANTVYAVIQDTITALDLHDVFEAGGFVGMSMYLSSIAQVVSVFLRIGTSSSHYNQWTWPVASLSAATWMNLRTPAASCDHAKNLGNGWNPAAITYVAVGVEFDLESRTLAGILVDHVHVVGGRITASDLTTAQTTAVNTANINVQRVGGIAAATGNGAVTQGTQRVTLASDSTGIVALTTSTASIGKLAANSGVDIGDVDVTSIIPGTGATNLGKAIDTALGATDTGVLALAVRDDTLNIRSGSENDVEPLHTNAAGALWVAGAANSGIDIGDVDVLSIVPGTGATNLGKAEDAGHNSGDVGVMALAIRDDTIGAMSGAEGDYEPLHTDATGRLYTNSQGPVAHDGTAAGNPLLLGAEALSAERAAVATTDVSKLVCDLVGKLIVLPYSNPENFVKGKTAAITDTTRTAVIAAQGAGVSLYITHVAVTNSHATVGTYVKIEDDTTEVYGGYCAAVGGGFSYTLPTPLKITANKALNVSCGTTGANVYACASGYKGAG